MVTPKTVCLVYIALLLEMMHADTIDTTINNNQTDDMMKNSTVSNTDVTSPHDQPTSSTKKTIIPDPALPLNCSPAIPQPTKEQCIFSLPIKDPLQMSVVVLTVVCMALLMTTLICACQVCHLRGIISGLRSRESNIDLHAVREKSETPWRNEDQADGHPTETCIMFSEVTTGQENEDIKAEEMNQTEQTPMMDTNGDVNVQEPDVNREKSGQPDKEPSTKGCEED